MMMKSSFVDDGILSQSCNLGQEIMFFLPLPSQLNLCLRRTPQR